MEVTSPRHGPGTAVPTATVFLVFFFFFVTTTQTHTHLYTPACASKGNGMKAKMSIASSRSVDMISGVYMKTINARGWRHGRDMWYLFKNNKCVRCGLDTLIMMAPSLPSFAPDVFDLAN